VENARNPSRGPKHHLPLPSELAAFADLGEDAAMQAANLADIETIGVEPVLREDLEAGWRRCHSKQDKIFASTQLK
jgi:hypothetical protein